MKKDTLVPEKMAFETTQLGNFVSFGIFSESLKLLDYQLSLKAKNFKTLNFHWLKKYSRRGFDQKSYFNTKVANNLFYGLVTEFYAVDYQIPKDSFGIRNYKFFSLPMILVYYSIGLYFVRLSERIFDHLNRTKNLKVFYGGLLRFQGNSLIKSYDSVHYKKHYKNFKRSIKNSINPKEGKKIVIRLDIQNYYDSIDISILLDFLNENVKPEIKNNYNFDQNTIEEIIFFFNYLMSGGKGIPQSEKNIVSDYIASLYLIIFDSAVENYLKSKRIKFNYSRFMDDIYISIDQFDGYKDQIGEIVQDLEQLMFDKVKLRLNLSKLKIIPINNEFDFHKFLEELKKVSVHGEMSNIINEESTKTLEEKCDELVGVILDIKFLPDEWADHVSDVDHIYDYENTQKEILKNIYDDDISNLLKTPKYKDQLVKIFKNFNFNLISIDPVPFLVLICLFDEIKSELILFLQKNNSSTLQRLWIIEKLLLIDSGMVKDVSIFEFLKKNNHAMYAKLLRITFFELGPNLEQSIYLYNKVIKWDLSLRPTVIEQIRHRFYSEKIKNYSNALNHLVNELHQICFEMDSSSKSTQYNAESVRKFLYENRLDFVDILKIENLFNRRNFNIISHPGLDKKKSWAVKRVEYSKYRNNVYKILGKLA